MTAEQTVNPVPDASPDLDPDFAPDAETDLDWAVAPRESLVPPPTRFARAKKAVASAFLSSLAGKAVVAVGRGLFSLARGFSVSGKLREARKHIMAGRPELALAAHDRILARYPHDLPARFHRLQSLLRLDRVAEAYQEAQALATAPDFPRDLRDQLTFRIAECECRLGDIPAALRKLKMDKDVPPRFNLAELMINEYADFAAADAVYAAAENLQRTQAGWLGPTAEGAKFFSTDWVRLIGHVGLLDLCAKAFHLGWFAPASRMVLAAPPHLVANKHFFRYLSPFFEVHETAFVAHIAENLGSRVACRLHLPDGRVKYFCEGMGEIQERWESEKRPPLLSLTEDDREFGRKLFDRLGIPEGAWIVTLHARDGGFHWESTNPHQAHRNTDIRTYLPAIAEITRRGGWVVRLGDKTMPKLPQLPQVVDYARSRFKSGRADVVLCALSRFFVGSTSGLCHMPYSFGIPTLLTNWCSNQLPIFGGRDRFIPKRLRERATGRELTFAEMLSPPNRIAAYSGTKLLSSGFVWMENSEDEIRDAVVEMLDDSAPPNEWARAFDRMARAADQFGFSRLGNAFAAKHAKLLQG